MKGVQIIGDDIWFDGYHVAIICPLMPATVLEDFLECLEMAEVRKPLLERLQSQPVDYPQPKPALINPWKGYNR